jgi:hypothetical protein
MDGSYSFRVMMWFWLGGRGGVGVPGASCPRWRPKATAAALVEDRAPVEIGEDQEVVEHEQVTGKLMRVWAGAEEVRCGLPTGGLCTAGEEEDDGDGMQLGHWELDAGSSRTACGCGCSAAAREREEKVKALGWPVHGDQEVAAGVSSGMAWRARVRPGKEREAVGTEGK